MNLIATQIQAMAQRHGSLRNAAKILGCDSLRDPTHWMSIPKEPKA